jgi:hypothetical protein
MVRVQFNLPGEVDDQVIVVVPAQLFVQPVEVVGQVSAPRSVGVRARNSIQGHRSDQVLIPPSRLPG